MRLLNLLFYINIVAVIYAQSHWNLDLKAHWHDTSLVATSMYSNIYNEIWGFQSNSHDYAVIGSTMGTHIIDVTNTDSIFQRAFIPGADQGTQIIHRDYHDYGGYLYMVCQEGSSTLQILNIAHLPDSLSLVYDTDSVFSQAHNIFIDTASSKMYACYVTVANPTPMFMGGAVYDLLDPLSPQLLYAHNQDVHDAFARDDTVFFNSAYKGLEVYDFKNDTMPVFLGSLTGYDFQGYNHSGWLTEDGKYYVMADENHGYPMKVLDVQDLMNINVLAHINSEEDPNSIPHNQIVMGDFLYTAYYYDGLYVHDISDPNVPKLVAYYDTYIGPNDLSYKGAWGVYPFLGKEKILVSDMQTGLYVLGLDAQASTYDFKNKKSDWNIYPSPSSGYISLDLKESNIEVSKVQIVDLSGIRYLEKDIDLALEEGLNIKSFNAPTLLFCLLLDCDGKAIDKKAFINL